jgi:hypothetical protein
VVKNPDDKCKIDGCERLSRSLGWCNTHHRRWQRTGDPGPAEVKKVSPKGSGWIDEYGYRRFMRNGETIFEHREVMERMIGRKLQPHETVHHKNGDRADNRPENLQLRSGKHGKGVVHRCLDCGSSNIGFEEI